MIPEQIIPTKTDKREYRLIDDKWWYCKPGCERCNVGCKHRAKAEWRICPNCGQEFLRQACNRQIACSAPCGKRSPIGATFLDKNGYVMVKVPTGTPGAHGSGWMLEHRFNMQQHIERPLLETETVHHKNLKRADNSIANLQLRQGPHGKGGVLVCGSCGSHDIRPEEL